MSRRPKKSEMSQKEIDRQDYVDNAIHNLIQDLCPIDSKEGIEWDIENIASVREEIEAVLVRKLKLCTEMQFYPYRELGPLPPCEGDNIYATIKCKIGAPCKVMHVFLPTPFALGGISKLEACEFQGWALTWPVELPGAFFVRHLDNRPKEFCVVHRHSGGLLGDAKTLGEAVSKAIVNIARTPDIDEQAKVLIARGHTEVSQKQYNGYNFT